MPFPTDPIAAFGSQDTPTGQKVADNFVLEGAGSIAVRSLRFIGGYGMTNPPPITPPLGSLPPDDFRIVFFEDAAGSPGMPLPSGEFIIGSAFSRTPTSGQLLNGVFTPMEYIVNLGSSITFNPSTEYWVSIINDTGPDHGWVWARAGGLIDQVTAATRNELSLDLWDTFTNGGMFIELNDQNVPEPKSYLILLIGLASFVLIGRGRRIKQYGLQTVVV